MSPDFQSLVNAINRLTAAQQKGPLDYISLIVLILTLAALVYYTWETIKICRAAHRQNETAVMPMMWIRVEPPQSRLSNTPQVPSHLVLCNDGHGPAFNVTIDSFSANGKTLTLDFGSNVIRPREERELVIHLQEGNLGQGGGVNELYYWINTGVLPDPVHIGVHCISVGITSYTFHFSFTPVVGILVVSLGRVVRNP